MNEFRGNCIEWASCEKPNGLLAGCPIKSIVIRATLWQTWKQHFVTENLNDLRWKTKGYISQYCNDDLHDPAAQCFNHLAPTLLCPDIIVFQVHCHNARCTLAKINWKCCHLIQLFLMKRPNPKLRPKYSSWYQINPRCIFTFSHHCVLCPIRDKWHFGAESCS